MTEQRLREARYTAQLRMENAPTQKQAEAYRLALIRLELVIFYTLYANA